MKNTIAILLTLALLLALSACGDSGKAFSGGSGTEADPYLISTADDLWEMAEKMNRKETVEEYTGAHYHLTADIDLGGKKEWTPIGYLCLNTEYYRFEGTFDGGGHTIRGIQIKYSDPLARQKRSLFGLFGQLEGTVKDLTIDNSSISASGDSSVHVGAIAGYVNDGHIVNCHTTGSVSVSGNYMIGGICGNINGNSELSGCTNAASVTATGTVGDAGGIAGRSGCQVVNCGNTGTVVSQEGQAAGITVSASNGLTDCKNSGDVTADDYAAGIVCNFSDGALNHDGNDNSVSILRCSNSGNVASVKDAAGGIAVSARAGSIADCVNSGSVTSPKETGGIFTYFQHGVFGAAAELFTVSGCSNSGTVTSTENYSSGGICGMIYGDGTRLVFENCSNTGSVQATGQKNIMVSTAEAGGIIGAGSISALEVRNCSNSGDVSGFAASGGIIGSASPVKDAENTTLLVADCENTGKIFTLNPGGLVKETYAGGIVGKCAVEAMDEEVLPAFDHLQIENCENTGILDGDREGDVLCTDDLCASYRSRLE